MGAFLLIIAFCAIGINSKAGKILRELECLHEDYDRITQSHEQLHWERESRKDAMIAEAMEKRKANA